MPDAERPSISPRLSEVVLDLESVAMFRRLPVATETYRVQYVLVMDAFGLIEDIQHTKTWPLACASSVHPVLNSLEIAGTRLEDLTIHLDSMWRFYATACVKLGDGRDTRYKASVTSEGVSVLDKDKIRSLCRLDDDLCDLIRCGGAGMSFILWLA
jgi:hypothetical protein